MASSSNSPCGACKFLRKKCTPECIFAPYFPPDQIHKFAKVHRIFGASNVSRFLNEVLPHQREDTATSLAYEADARLRDPVYGSAGVISVFHRQHEQSQSELSIARSDICKIKNSGIAGPLIGGPSSNLSIATTLPGTTREHNFREQIMETQLSSGQQQTFRNHDQEIAARTTASAYNPSYSHPHSQLNVSGTLGPLNPSAQSSRTAGDDCSSPIGTTLPGATREHNFREQIMETQFSSRQQQMFQNHDQEIAATITASAYNPSYGHSHAQLNVSGTLSPLNRFAQSSRTAGDDYSSAIGMTLPGTTREHIFGEQIMETQLSSRQQQMFQNHDQDIAARVTTSAYDPSYGHPHTHSNVPGTLGPLNPFAQSSRTAGNDRSSAIGTTLPGTTRGHNFREQIMETQLSSGQEQMFQNHDQEIAARVTTSAYDPSYGHSHAQLNVSGTLGALNPFAQSSRTAVDDSSSARGIGPP